MKEPKWLTLEMVWAIHEESLAVFVGSVDNIERIRDYLKRREQLTALQVRQLQAMLYKGEAIVRLTHRDFSRRPMADIDLLVGPEVRQHAREALVEAGFEPTSHDNAMHDVLRETGRPSAGQPRGVTVELHGDVFPPPHPFRLGLADVLDRARQIKAVCDRHGVPLKAAALQFGLAHPAVAATIPGPRSPAEVEENVRMVGHPIPADLWAELKAAQLIPGDAPEPAI